MQHQLTNHSGLVFSKLNSQSMSTRFLALTAILFISLSSFAQQSKRDMKKDAAKTALNPSPYAIFNALGEVANYDEMVIAALDADVVLFGELHDNPMLHWLQLMLTEDLGTKANELVLGAEMLEADDQLPVDEYLSGVITYSKLKTNARLWSNFETDYLPLLDYAYMTDIPFIATNVPRRYASFVFKHGLDTLSHLSDEALKYLPPLPISYPADLGCYVEILEMAGGHGGENLPKAQAIKDATMAHFITLNLPENGIFIHYNGAFHSQNKEGIAWYLLESNPELRIMTIHAVEQDSVSTLYESNYGLGDFIIVTPENLTKTH